MTNTIRTEEELLLIFKSNNAKQITAQSLRDFVVSIYDAVGEGGGGGTPSAPTNSVQFNNAGAFGGGPTLLTDGTYIILGDGTASGNYSTSFGQNTVASGNYSHAEGNSTTASGEASHAEGNGTTASGIDGAHAEGAGTHATGAGSHAEGSGGYASGDYSHKEGGNGTASGYASHCEGIGTTASGDQAHAEGLITTASGLNSHAQGNSTQAIGTASHSEGTYTSALGINSHAMGNYSIARFDNQFAQSSGSFAANADAQFTRVIMRRLTSNNTATELTIDGASPTGEKLLYLGTDTIYAAMIRIVALGTSGTSAEFTRKCLIHNNAGVTALVGSVQTIGTDIGSNGGVPPAGWAIAITANDTDNYLKITVTGQVSTDIHWVCCVELVETILAEAGG